LVTPAVFAESSVSPDKFANFVVSLARRRWHLETRMASQIDVVSRRGWSQFSPLAVRLPDARLANGQPVFYRQTIESLSPEPNRCADVSPQ
jgi:hypothetical protein